MLNLQLAVLLLSMTALGGAFENPLGAKQIGWWPETPKPQNWPSRYIEMNKLYASNGPQTGSSKPRSKRDLGPTPWTPETPTSEPPSLRLPRFMLYQNWQSMYNDMNVQLSMTNKGKTKLYKPRAQRAAVAEPQEPQQHPKRPLITTKPIKIENWGLLRQPMAFKDERDWITFPLKKISSDWSSQIQNANFW